LDENDLAKVVERQVNKLDRKDLDEAYGGSGDRPYDPIAMLKMVLYQYLKGEQSPAAWVDEAKNNRVMQWLGRGYVPGRTTWYYFRDRASKFVEPIHAQIVKSAMDDELFDPSVGVQDGTAVAACASRHRMINGKTLHKRIEILEGVLDDTFDGEVPKWVPPTLTGKEDLSDRMQKAAEILDIRIQENAKRPSDKRRDPVKIMVSTSDPAAPLGRDKMKVYRPLYTTQMVVAAGSLIIMSFNCAAAATDAGTLAPMIDKTQKIVDGQLRTVLADAAYCTIVDLKLCQERKIELLAPVHSNALTASRKKSQESQQIPKEEFVWNELENHYVCPEGHRVEYQDRTRKRRSGDHYIWEYRYRCNPVHCQGCPLAHRCLRPEARSRTIKRLEGQELLDAQMQRMATTENQTRFQQRGQTIELTFADSKGNRQWMRFHGRGLDRAQAETGIMVVARNLMRIDRLERSRVTPSEVTT
jgi:transposase